LPPDSPIQPPEELTEASAPGVALEEQALAFATAAPESTGSRPEPIETVAAETAPEAVAVTELTEAAPMLVAETRIETAEPTVETGSAEPAALADTAGDVAASNEAAPTPSPAASDDVGAIVAGSGLIMIETDSSKLPQFGTGAPEAPVLLGRRPRAAPVIAEEPLQQVETHK
jgi:hypothetical protein